MLQKLERKFGRFAIPGLMKYVIGLYIVGYILYLINPNIYYSYLMFDVDQILKGQVWRLVTFVVQPIRDGLLWTLLMCYVYYNIGTNLEQIWGTFRFNLYYFMGIFFNVLATIIVYIIMRLVAGVGFSVPISLDYLNLSMFLAFAATFPDLQFRFMFLIPIKGKYLAIGYLLLMAYDILDAFRGGVFSGIIVGVSIIVSLLNFFIYYMMTRRYLSPRNIKRRMDFSRSYTDGMRQSKSRTTIDPVTGNKTITRHKCAVCGRTELDGDNLEFRFCSKCNGNYEYCQDHLFTHEHIV